MMLISDCDVGAAGFWLVQKIRQLLKLDWEVKVCHTRTTKLTFVQMS